MSEKFWINEEIRGNGKYYTVSGVDGKYEYYRIGVYHTKEEAQAFIDEYIANNKIESTDTAD